MGKAFPVHQPVSGSLACLRFTGLFAVHRPVWECGKKANDRFDDHGDLAVRAAWRDVPDRVKRLRSAVKTSHRSERADRETVQLKKRRALKQLKRLRKQAGSRLYCSTLEELEEEIRDTPVRV